MKFRVPFQCTNTSRQTSKFSPEFYHSDSIRHLLFQTQDCITDKDHCQEESITKHFCASKLFNCAQNNFFLRSTCLSLLLTKQHMDNIKLEQGKWQQPTNNINTIRLSFEAFPLGIINHRVTAGWWPQDATKKFTGNNATLQFKSSRADRQHLTTSHAGLLTQHIRFQKLFCCLLQKVYSLARNYW